MKSQGDKMKLIFDKEINLKSYYIYELPKNSINNLKKGDKLTIL